MDTEMTCYESFAEVTEDFYCSAVDVLKINYAVLYFRVANFIIVNHFSTSQRPI